MSINAITDGRVLQRSGFTRMKEARSCEGVGEYRGDNDCDAESLSRHFYVSPNENCNLSRQRVRGLKSPTLSLAPPTPPGTRDRQEREIERVSALHLNRSQFFFQGEKCMSYVLVFVRSRSASAASCIYFSAGKKTISPSSASVRRPRRRFRPSAIPLSARIWSSGDKGHSGAITPQVPEGQPVYR